MCGPGEASAAPSVLPEPADWHGEQVVLEPVDSVSVLTVCDNTVDMLLPDQGPARRLGMGAMGGAPKVAAPTLAGGQAVDAPLAQHGFSALVTVRRGDRAYRVLFDTGMTPDGCVENLRRLDVNPSDIDVLVLSHGHFDHTTGLSGLVGTPCPSCCTPRSGRGGGWPSLAAIRSRSRRPAGGRSRRPASTSSRHANRPCCSTTRCWSPARST